MICKISREADWTPLNFYDLFPTDKEFLTVRELSKLLEIHEKTIRYWIKNCRSDFAPKRVQKGKRECLLYSKEDIFKAYPAHFKAGLKPLYSRQEINDLDRTISKSLTKTLNNSESK